MNISFYQYETEETIMKRVEIEEGESKVEGVVAFTLKHLQGAFFILLLCCLAATLVFLTEVLWATKGK
ncbi:hypothetical protein Pmani_001158 [Petrolisthes manimaculis]|uniref:Uncharacterized protein n=1 Tax=Petrolisthes manimaculis TaxID=1843537 RepID=A0AAE1QKK0_9EUCA|nr:hypothetical protein Pmani_001158 [Petrolisthes manimaculis]